ncbi:hypothetical protein LNV09_14090 [Paucibacter sp. B2R-40]|uniref:hypothetical protein n=1 Tax=Paucibacter sp. B2R-40 TaxID=2893554 RepID=UPI0021E4171B|nr:hypothetical protein [Paucibacter sp. B2R-40]MCV2355282.1 hypothetical protein [Paucibacter sp. B2R-40]
MWRNHPCTSFAGFALGMPMAHLAAWRVIGMAMACNGHGPMIYLVADLLGVLSTFGPTRPSHWPCFSTALRMHDRLR